MTTNMKAGNLSSCDNVGEREREGEGRERDSEGWRDGGREGV